MTDIIDTAPAETPLKDRPELDQLARDGGSALADVLRRARDEAGGERAQHHSYNSHSSNPW